MTKRINHTITWWLCHIPYPTGMWIVWARFVDNDITVMGNTVPSPVARLRNTQKASDPSRGISFSPCRSHGPTRKTRLMDLLSYLPRGRMFGDDSLPHGGLLAAAFSQMQQKVWTHWSLTFRTEKRKSSFLEESVSAQTSALLGQEPPWPGSHWADDEGVFIITVLGQVRLPDGVFHALARATAQAIFRGRSLCSSSQNVASASQHGYVPTSTIRQPLHKRLRSRGSLYESGQSLFLTLLWFSCDLPANVQTETLQQPMPCDELCFRAFVWWAREVNLLIFVLHTRRLTLSQDLSHCLVKQLDHGKSKRVPEKHLFLLYGLCQSLWLCGSQ